MPEMMAIMLTSPPLAEVWTPRISGEAILVPPVRPFFFDFVNCEDVVAAIVVDGF